MKNDQEPFEPNDPLAELDAHLRLVLRADAPDGLADDVFNATAEKLPLDPQLTELDAQLRDALAPGEAPAGLTDRVFAATVEDALAGDPQMAELEAQLREGMPVAAPSGLADRLFDATVDQLGAEEEQPLVPVVARIGFAPEWRGAVAAMLLLALSAGLWLASFSPTPKRPTLAAIEPVAAIELAMEDIERSLAQSEAIDDQIDTLDNEIEQTFDLMEQDIFANSFVDSTDMLYDDLYMLDSGGGLSF
ncbi:MAG: hypothetical protein ACYTGQ_07000 [Planctomycetota bacterium]|jgi:hypothetical protein